MKRVLFILFFLSLFFSFGIVTNAHGLTEEDVAEVLSKRLGGEPIGLAPDRNQIMALARARNFRAVAQHISTTRAGFLNATVKEWAAVLVTRSRDTQQEWNEGIAFLVGLVKDNRDAREIFTGNYTYVGDEALLTAANVTPSRRRPSQRNDDHYVEIGRLPNPASVLVRRGPQREQYFRFENNAFVPDFSPVPENETTGLFTTRSWGQQHIATGTNRRDIQYKFSSFLCADFQPGPDVLVVLKDTSTQDTRIRRDVDRSPGGQTSVFLNNCKGCHGTIDGFGGSNASFNFGEMFAWQASPQNKMNQNGTIFPGGYVTTDSSWVNVMRPETQRRLGWPASATDGEGALSLTAAMAETDAFPRCMAHRTFSVLCRRHPEPNERSTIETLAAEFRASGYNLRTLFEATSVVKDCLYEF